jgi:GAF domain
MPGAGTKRQRSESVNTIATTTEQQMTPGVVLSDFEQICVAMPASGAVIAVRDLAGVLCTVSFGNALAVGSRLPTDSAFTRECIETGEVVRCEDTESDPRIHPSVATQWKFRSAVAVPIQAQGEVVALIEVFCSRPSAIYPSAIATLKGVAKSFAALMIFDADNGGQPIVGGSLEHPIVLPSLIADENPPSVANPDIEVEVVEQPKNREVPGTVAPISQLLSDRPTPTRVWVIAAAILLGLSLLLFLFRGAYHN